MILDSRTEFCDAVSLNTGAAGSYLLGNQVDVSLAGVSTSPGHIGAAESIYLVISVDTGIAVAAGTGSLSFRLVSDAQAAILTDGTATEHLTFGPFGTSTTSGNAGAVLGAGAVLACVELPKTMKYERYLGIIQQTGTTAISAGKINAFLTPDPAAWAAFDSPAQA